MTITEKDFKIEYNDTAFILYLLKSKKELKIDKDAPVIEKDPDAVRIDLYKIGGYFKNVDMAIYNAYRFRRNKKYSFKESAEPLKVQYRQYKNISNQLYSFLTNMYIPIAEIEKKLLNQ